MTAALPPRLNHLWRVDEITSAAGLSALRPEWTRLWRDCTWATPFQSPEWLLTWWEHLCLGGDMWTLAVRRHGVLAGLAPMFLHGDSRDPKPRHISFIGAGVSDYLDMLARPEHSAGAAQAVVGHILSRQSRWSQCEFKDLPDRSPLLSCMPPDAAFADSDPCLSVLLPPHTGPAFGMSLRRARAKLDRQPGAALEVAGPERREEYLNALIRLHSARWTSKHESGVLDAPAIRAFHQRVSERLQNVGMLRLFGIRIDGALVAVLYCFAWRRRYYGYLSGFDPDAAPLSPGKLLLAHAMEHAAAEGCFEFDFLRKSERYKLDWGARPIPKRRITLVSQRYRTA